MSSTPALMEAPHDKDLVASLEPSQRKVQINRQVFRVRNTHKWKGLSVRAISWSSRLRKGVDGPRIRPVEISHQYLWPCSVT